MLKGDVPAKIPMVTGSLVFKKISPPFSTTTSTVYFKRSVPTCSAIAPATAAIGNCLKSKDHIASAIDFGKKIDGVNGIVVIIGEAVGMWGDLEVVPLNLP